MTESLKAPREPTLVPSALNTYFREQAANEPRVTKVLVLKTGRLVPALRSGLGGKRRWKALV